MRGVEDGGQTEVKLLGAVQISHLHSGQEKRKRGRCDAAVAG